MDATLLPLALTDAGAPHLWLGVRELHMKATRRGPQVLTMIRRQTALPRNDHVTARRWHVGAGLEPEPGSTAYSPVEIDRVRIGRLADRCGVTRDTIRFYERAGLLPKPRRTPSRHRLYDQKTADLIRFIRHAQNLGLTLEDIRQLVELREYDSAWARQRVSEILRARLRLIEQRMSTFEGFRWQLAQHLALCPGGGSEGCRTLLELSAESKDDRKEA